MNCKSPNWCKNIRDSPLDSPVFNPPDSFSSLWFIKHHTPAGVNISVFCADIMRFLRTELQIASKKKNACRSFEVWLPVVNIYGLTKIDFKLCDMKDVTSGIFGWTISGGWHITNLVFIVKCFIGVL